VFNPGAQKHADPADPDQAAECGSPTLLLTNFIFEKTMPGLIWRPGIDVAGRRGRKKLKNVFSLTVYTVPGWQTTGR
jgi:hypothetical protein